MSKSYILAIDQGTSSTKTLIFDEQGMVVAKGSEPLKTLYEQGGYVEQDPEEIYQNVLRSVQQCLAHFTAAGHDITAIQTCGISNQRETFVVWDEKGRPLYNAIVWQCKRSIDICKTLKAQELEPMIKKSTGLIIDPYFSGSKMIWLYQQVPEIRQAVNNGKAYFGTVDTWLLFKLTNGKSYQTDYTNASRTLFFNLETLQWDKQLLEHFQLSKLNLPTPAPSSYHFGKSSFEGLFPAPISIDAMIGDSHAAAFGEGCFHPGTAKATLGTGCSVLMNIGNKVKISEGGMITTICWSTETRVDYAYEGVIVSCGATIEWLRNELELFTDYAQIEALAIAAGNSNGVYLVPAFSGLGAPHWQMDRKASITGLTFDCNKKHVLRAALESIPFQVRDVLDAMEADSGILVSQLMLNGGMTSNHFVLEFLAGLLPSEVVKSTLPDVSALGAGCLAGLKRGIFPALRGLSNLHANKTIIQGDKYIEEAAIAYQGWKANF